MVKNIMANFEFVEKAIDASGFQLGGASATSAGYINPDIWNRTLLSHTESQLVVAKMGMTYNDLLNQPGEVLNVQIDAEPTEASALTETVDVPIDALSFTQVTFTPTEYGAAYQVSDKEARRSFFDLMQNIVTKLGYRMALKKEKLVVALLQANAGNAVVANGVASSAIASTDTININAIVNARKEIKKDKYVPTDLIIGVEQEADLLKLSNFNDVSKYGSRDAILGGFIGRAFGVDIYWSDLITPSSSKAKAIMLGVSKTGEKAFGIANKKTASIETERHARGRYTDFVGVEEYQAKVLHANAICTIETYAA